MTQHPTPDSIQTAIAWVLWWTQPENYERTPPLELPNIYTDRASAIYDRLAQMGALRPVGDGVSKRELRAAAEEMFTQAHQCSYLQDPDKWTNHTRGCNDGDHRLFALIDRLPIANGADDTKVPPTTITE